jgi:hypothetical protein
MSQRSGFVAILFAMPAYIETKHTKSVDWKELFNTGNLVFSLFTTAMLMFWQTIYLDGVQKTT